MTPITTEAGLYGVMALPVNAIRTEVTLLLRRLRPQKHLSFTELWTFDVDTFVFDGHAQRTARPDVPPVFRLIRDETNTRLEEDVRAGWFEVCWQGHTFEVVSLTWEQDNCTERFSWVLGETREIVEGFIDAVTKYGEEVRGQVLVFEDSRFRKSENLYKSIQRADFDDLVLSGSMKDDLRGDVARFFSRKAFYESHRIPWKRGLLFIGPPGNGKTQTLKALLKEIGLPVLYVKSFKERNEDAKNIRNVFARARKASPCVLVVEDLDCALDESARSIFLNELDGFAENVGLLTLATTNHPHKLDRSILDRPSRFDRKFHFALPAAIERRTFISRWNLQQAPVLRLSDAGLAHMVDRTDGFTFAYLKEALLSAALAWVDDARPGAMDEISARVVKGLRKEMESAHVVLGPEAGSVRQIGFSDRA